MGDRAFANAEGKIVGVNLGSKKISVDFTRVGDEETSMNTYSLDDITIGGYSSTYGESDPRRFTSTREEFVANFNK